MYTIRSTHDDWSILIIQGRLLLLQWMQTRDCRDDSVNKTCVNIKLILLWFVDPKDFLRILWIFPEGYTGGYPKGLTCMPPTSPQKVCGSLQDPFCPHSAVDNQPIKGIFCLFLESTLLLLSKEYCKDLLFPRKSHVHCKWNWFRKNWCKSWITTQV